MTDTQINEVVDALKQRNKEIIDEQIKGNLDGVSRGLADMDEKIEAMNKRFETSFADLQTRLVAPGAVVENDETRKSYVNYIRQGVVDSMTAGTSSAGGVLVPTPQVEEIVKLVGNGNPMRELASVRTIGGEAYKFAVRITVGSAAYGVETGAPGTSGAVVSRANTATPTFATAEIRPVELYSWQPVTQQLLDDAAFDVEAEVREGVAEQFAELENSAFFNGNGSAGAMQGIIGGVVTSADASATGTTVGYIAGGSASAIGNADKVFELQAALDDRYQENATWLMNKGTYNTLRTMKVGANMANAYLLWQPEFIGGRIAMTLAGAPVRRCSAMPDIGANAFPVAYGDFRQAYQIVDRTGVTLLRDPYTQNPFVVFKFTRRVGGGVRNAQAYKLLKVAVS